VIVAKRFVVTGRVQGVGFRWFVQETAALEGASGWVMNRPDGAVEALVQGEAEAVQRVERKIRRGPPSARVQNVDVFDETPSDRTGSFVIR